MPYPILDDLNLKIAWAEQHLHEMKAVISDYRRIATYRITKHDEPLHGHCVVRVHPPAQAPTTIPLLLSDFIYATRSALDHLAWQLAHLTLPEPPSTVQFPIYSSSNSESQGKFKGRVKGMPSAAVDEIERLQPYHRGAAYGDDPLWKLNELSNIDKHRVFAVHGETLTSFASPTGYSTTRFDTYMEYRWPLSQKENVVFHPYLSELTFGKPMDLPGPVFEVTLADLTEMHRFVRDDVLPRFTRFFGPTG